MEGAGTIEVIGEDVEGLNVGDKVSHCMNIGAYTERMLIDANKLILLDKNTSLEIAAACTLQGLTAQYLLHESWKLEPGQTVLVHAAAGGVGQAALQIAKRSGARVFATASTLKQPKLLKQGVEQVFDSRSIAFADQILDHTNGGKNCPAHEDKTPYYRS